jgi:PAS domain S-box-containing protein
MIRPERTVRPRGARGANKELRRRYAPLAALNTVIRAVTDQKRAEAALRESEARFSRIFHQNPVAMAITSQADGRFFDVNPTWERLFGYSRSELLGHTSIEVGLFADSTERQSRLRQARGKRFFAGAEIRLRAKSGEVRDLLASTQVLDLGGEACFLSTFQDITGRKRTEEALRDSELKYRTLFEAESDALFLIDNATGRLLEANSAAVALYGYSRDELLRMRNTDLSAQPGETRRATRSGSTLVPLRFHRKKNGTVIPVEITACHIDWHGRRVHLAAIRDITERRKAEEAMRDLSHRLLQAQDAERRRIARDLHDSTAQKLAALIMALGRLDAALTGAADSGTRRLAASCLATAEDCVQEIRSLSHLLHPPLLDELGLETALGTFVEGFSRRSGISVALDVPPDLGRLPADVELALFRVVQEGLGNILKHADSPRASVRLARDPNAVRLEVRDRGRGIPPRILQGIRERRPRLGIGIGIAGMQERIGPLGGTLEIESSGRGTTLRAVIPLAPGAS